MKKHKRLKAHIASCRMYVQLKNGVPVAYAYGEPWVAQALWMGDIGYKTPEEAKEAWRRKQNDHGRT